MCQQGVQEPRGRVRWGLDEPICFTEARDLIQDLKNPHLGKPLNWGGLRMYLEGGPTVVIRRGYCSLVELYPSGDMVLNRGHIRNPITRNVINAFSPMSITQNEHDWVFDDGTLFVDGCGISAKGYARGPKKWDPASKLEPFLEKYVWSFVHAAERGEPDVLNPGANCWECFYYSSPEIDGQRIPQGAEPGGVAHLFKHIMKLEFFGETAFRAISEYPNKGPGRTWGHIMGTPYMPTDSPLLGRILKTFLYRRLGMLSAFGNKNRRPDHE